MQVCQRACCIQPQLGTGMGTMGWPCPLRPAQSAAPCFSVSPQCLRLRDMISQGMADTEKFCRPKA